MESWWRRVIVSVMRKHPSFRAATAGTGETKNNQACAPLPERDRSTATGTPRAAHVSTNRRRPPARPACRSPQPETSMSRRRAEGRRRQPDRLAGVRRPRGRSAAGTPGSRNPRRSTCGLRRSPWGTLRTSTRSRTPVRSRTSHSADSATGARTHPRARGTATERGRSSARLRSERRTARRWAL